MSAARPALCASGASAPVPPHLLGCASLLNGGQPAPLPNPLPALRSRAAGGARLPCPRALRPLPFGRVLPARGVCGRACRAMPARRVRNARTRPARGRARCPFAPARYVRCPSVASSPRAGSKVLPRFAGLQGFALGAPARVFALFNSLL